MTETDGDLRGPAFYLPFVFAGVVWIGVWLTPTPRLPICKDPFSMVTAMQRIKEGRFEYLMCDPIDLERNAL